MNIFDIARKHKEEGHPCKGLFFRGSSSLYVKDLLIVSRRQVKFLKRASCTGCNGCNWFWESIGEEAADRNVDLDHIEQGKIYEAVFVEDGQDLETGLCDDWHIDFREVKREMRVRGSKEFITKRGLKGVS